jgi:hypothetical protein
VVITIPSAKGDRPVTTSPQQTTDPDPTVAPCVVTVSSDTLRLNRSGGTQAVIVGREDNGEINDLEVAGVPEVLVRRETVAGVTSRALYVIRAATPKTGLYQVTFKLPCGSKTIEVSVH